MTVLLAITDRLTGFCRKDVLKKTRKRLLKNNAAKINVRKQAETKYPTISKI